MLTVEIAQLYPVSPPPVTDQKPQPAAGVQTPDAASASSSNGASRRFRYTPTDSTGSWLLPQHECPSSPPLARKQASTASAESPSPEEKHTSTDVKNASEAPTVPAMPAGVRSTTPMPLAPLRSHREANLLTAATPEQRRFHQSLRPSSPRIGAHTSRQARRPAQPRRPVLQKRARENDIKPETKPAAPAKMRASVTASRPKKVFYTEQDAQRDLKTLSDTQKLLVPAIELNAARLPSEQLAQMKAIALEIRSLMKTIGKANPASSQEASKLRRRANELSGKAKSHLIYIRNNYVRETLQRPEVREPRPEIEVIVPKKINHATRRKQFSAYRNQQRDMLELKKTIGHCFIEHPAMQYRTKESKENIVEIALASTQVILGFGGNSKSGEAQLAKDQSDPDAGYCSQESNQTSPIGSPVHSAPPSPPKWEQAASTAYKQSNGHVFIAGSLPKTAFMPKLKHNVWRRLLKRIKSVLIPPSSGRSLLPIAESPNVTLVSYTRKR